MKTTTDEILHTAIRMFKEKSFDEVSLDEICKECGISKPTFYKYVPSKEAILTGFYDIVCQNIMLHFADVYQADSYYEQFHLFYDMIIDSSLELGPGLISRMIILNLQQNSHSFDTREQLTRIVIQLIRKGQKNGEFKSETDAETLYDAINFIFLGLEVKWAMRNGETNWKENFARLSDAILEAGNT